MVASCKGEQRMGSRHTGRCLGVRRTAWLDVVVLGLRLRRGKVEVLRRGRREGRVEGLGWWCWFLVLGSWYGWMDVCGMCSRVFSHAW